MLIPFNRNNLLKQISFNYDFYHSKKACSSIFGPVHKSIQSQSVRINTQKLKKKKNSIKKGGAVYKN